MHVDKIFDKNFLSSKHNRQGVLSATFFLTICSILSLFYWDGSFEFSKYLSANYKLVVTEGEVWRLFTTSLIHGDLEHLLANSLMLYILTYFVTSFYGVMYSLVISLVVGMLTNYLVIIQYSTNTTLVGASGIVYYLWGFWLVLYFFIQTHLTVMRRILIIGAVFFILLIPTQYNPNTSYLAHYIGFTLGLIIGSLYYLINKSSLKKYEKWKYKVIDDEVDFDWESSD